MAGGGRRAQHLSVEVVQPAWRDPTEVGRRIRAICDIGLAVARARQPDRSGPRESLGSLGRPDDANAREP
ncbi:MAG TPA: hypothetical protein VNL71_20880 [Chloroflexota bacterium]|nr:hypothetical protein [Chloroflexota bacterium]